MKESWTLGALAKRLDGTVVGEPSYVIDRVVSPKKLRAGAITCLWNAVFSSSKEKGEGEVTSTPTKNFSEEGCFVAVPGFFNHHPGSMGVAVDNPKKVFPLLLSLFVRRTRFASHHEEGCPEEQISRGSAKTRGFAGSAGVHPTAVVSEEAFVSPSAWIGPLCVIEAGARIEEGAILRSHVFVGEESFVGADTVIEPGAVLLENVSVGRSCLIHSGAVLGCDGFGVSPSESGSVPEKIPQLGGVVLGDNVEIGSCTTVDRGTLDDTEIGSGTKIDNHVHVAHNVRIGENCIVVAMSGLAGSAVLEDNVIMAARSGVKEHTRVGKGAIVAAQGGATKDVPPGAVVSGFPARPHKDNFRIQAALQRLPEMMSRLKELEKRLDGLASAEGMNGCVPDTKDSAAARDTEKAAESDLSGISARKKGRKVTE